MKYKLGVTEVSFRSKIEFYELSSGKPLIVLRYKVIHRGKKWAYN